ncbi:MAG: hypothetical protein LM513_02575 [Nitrospira sp.]|nr:hypothetical protein [Nitrospira sp.]
MSPLTTELQLLRLSKMLDAEQLYFVAIWGSDRQRRGEGATSIELILKDI